MLPVTEVIAIAVPEQAIDCEITFIVVETDRVEPTLSVAVNVIGNAPGVVVKFFKTQR